jgi:E3 ubiquitin-protein ligase HUWE1
MTCALLLLLGQEVALSRDNNNADKTITASSLNQILPESTQCHILTDYTSIFNFDVKRTYFRHELDRLKQNLRDEDLTIHVRRDNVLDDSFRELSQRSLQDWKHRFSIIFDDNEGQNPNDNLTIWYSMIIRSILDPNYGLFIKNSHDHLTYMPNPLSYSNKNHLEYFKFLGHIIGKSIFDKKYIDCHFTRPFYKYILDILIDYTDIERLDLDLTFSLDVNKRIELIPNGSTVQVTNENKCEYIRVVCQEKIIGSIKQQMNSFLEGFYGIIPKCLISIFNEQELELFITGKFSLKTLYEIFSLRRFTSY